MNYEIHEDNLSSMPLVSVIINCYNGADFLRNAIESIYAQSYQNWEIIFWDNASTDESAKIAKSFDSRLKYYASDQNVPLGEARNFALEKVTGKYIAFLDCDDSFLPSKLNVQVQLMETSNFGMAYCGAIIIDDRGKILSERLPKNRSGYIFSNLLINYEINMQSVMLRKSFLDERLLKFNTSLRFCPDYNLFMRISSLSEVGVLNCALVVYRRSSSSLSSRMVDVVSNEMKYTLDEVFFSSPNLREKYASSALAAYDKLYYYDAVAHIHRSEFRQARENLRNIIFKRWEYCVLFLALFLPLSKARVLRLLNR